MPAVPAAPADRSAPDRADPAPVPATPSAADHTTVLRRAANREHPNGAPFLVAEGLAAKGRNGPIFTGIDLTAGLGQVVAVCGDSGDGRTSLLLALAGRFAVESGTLRVDGQRAPGQIRRRFTVAQAGPPIHFEEYHTVGSCIKETTAVSGGTATSANIHAWLDRLALAVDTGDTFGFLPRIDQITFAIACAAASRTPAVVVDDTDTGLDRCGSERVFEALRTVADAGQLVLAACTRSDPPSDTVVDLRGLSETPRRHEGRTRKGGHQ
ncbi:ATP-binding cassette domain-containing protein [Glycomyces paridis]|uniref:ATP-binding cassette domain-containing protein n=2 Tax=Glycomyces paridis TaxID=2126555 RepID=A0A4S8P991_9ACTN|nr:ATP-binding cassette domain-containing protein [Glycomyces paridis]